MRPVASSLKLTNLRGITLDLEANVIAVKEFTVDYPLAILTIEFEAPRNALGHPNWIQVESGIGSRIYAVVSDCVRYDPKLKHFVTLSRGQDVVCRPSSVALLETVLQVDD